MIVSLQSGLICVHTSAMSVITIFPILLACFGGESSLSLISSILYSLRNAILSLNVNFPSNICSYLFFLHMLRTRTRRSTFRQNYMSCITTLISSLSASWAEPAVSRLYTRHQVTLTAWLGLVKPRETYQAEDVEKCAADCSLLASQCRALHYGQSH